MRKEIRPGRMRMAFDLPTDIFKDVEALAFHENITKITIIIRALVAHINEQKDVLKPYREARK